MNINSNSSIYVMYKKKEIEIIIKKHKLMSIFQYINILINESKF